MKMVRIIFAFAVAMLILNISLLSVIIVSFQSVEGLPSITIKMDISDISEDGLDIVMNMDIYNQNGIDMEISNLVIEILRNEEKTLGDIVIDSLHIPSRSHAAAEKELKIPMEILDSDIITVKITGDAVVSFLGVKKNLGISSQIEVINLDIDRLLSLLPIEMETRSNYRLSPAGLKGTVSVYIGNPYNISLLIENVTLNVYRVENGNEVKIYSVYMGGGVAEPGGSLELEKNVLIPYNQLRGGGFKILPEWFKSSMDADVRIPILNRSIKVRLSSYRDMHLLRLWG